MASKDAALTAALAKLAGATAALEMASKLLSNILAKQDDPKCVRARPLTNSPRALDAPSRRPHAQPA